MAIEALNIISVILAILATLYLFATAYKCAKGLRTGFMLVGIGILISLGIHSIAEFMEVRGYLSTKLLIIIMPVLVLVGSVFIVLGTYVLWDTIKRVVEK